MRTLDQQLAQALKQSQSMRAQQRSTRDTRILAHWRRNPDHGTSEIAEATGYSADIVRRAIQRSAQQ